MLENAIFDRHNHYDDFVLVKVATRICLEPMPSYHLFFIIVSYRTETYR